MTKVDTLTTNFFIIGLLIWQILKEQALQSANIFKTILSQLIDQLYLWIKLAQFYFKFLSIERLGGFFCLIFVKALSWTLN